MHIGAPWEGCRVKVKKCFERRRGVAFSSGSASYHHPSTRSRLSVWSRLSAGQAWLARWRDVGCGFFGGHAGVCKPSICVKSERKLGWGWWHRGEGVMMRMGRVVGWFGKVLRVGFLSSSVMAVLP